MQHKVNFIDHKSVLVVNRYGQLKKLEVPFRVYALGSAFPQKQFYEVTEVLCTDKDELVYMIDSRPFFHHHFAIDVHF